MIKYIREDFELTAGRVSRSFGNPSTFLPPQPDADQDSENGDDNNELEPPPFPHEVHDPCGIYRTIAEEATLEYEGPIRACCNDFDTPCFFNKSIRQLLEDIVRFACARASFDDPDAPLTNIDQQNLQDVAVHIRQELEKLLANC